MRFLRFLRLFRLERLDASLALATRHLGTLSKSTRIWIRFSSFFSLFTWGFSFVTDTCNSRDRKGASQVVIHVGWRTPGGGPWMSPDFGWLSGDGVKVRISCRILKTKLKTRKACPVYWLANNTQSQFWEFLEFLESGDKLLLEVRSQITLWWYGVLVTPVLAVFGYDLEVPTCARVLFDLLGDKLISGQVTDRLKSLGVLSLPSSIRNKSLEISIFCSIGITTAILSIEKSYSIIRILKNLIRTQLSCPKAPSPLSTW